MADAKIWDERIAAWRASGLTQTQFCAREGLARGTLGRWLRRQRGDEAPPRAAVRLAQLVRVPAVPPPPSANPALVIEVGGVRVTVGHGADVTTVVTVLAMVGAGGAR